jgi:hypothetical protein
MQLLSENLGINRDSNSQNGNSLRNVNVHSHTLPHSRASFSARDLTSPCLGHEPKTRVVKWRVFIIYLFIAFLYYKIKLFF